MTIQVTAVNDVPISQADTYEIESGTELTGNVLDNDSDKEGDELSVSLLQPVGNGELSLQTDGQFTYQSESTFSGVQTFSYEVVDSNGGTSAPATVELTVTELSVTEPADSNLLVHLPLDDGLDPATDVSGNGHSGGLAGGAFYESLSVDGLSLIHI